MYDIEERKNRDGTVTYRVRWRDGGARPTYTFNTGKLGPAAADYAQRFHALVEANGDRLPERAVLQAYGLAWIVADATAEDGKEISPARTMVVTVAEVCRRYLVWLKASVNAPTKRTTDEYEDYLRRDIACRPLGDCDITTVAGDDIDAWQLQLLTTVGPYGRKKLGRNSVLKIRSSLLAPAVEWACSSRSGPPPLRTAPSPLRDSIAPVLEQAPRRDLLFTPAEYRQFLSIAYAVDRDWAAMLAIGAVTGLRRGELIQLGPAAVDEGRGVLYIVERYTEGLVEKGRKNGEAGEVPVPAWMMRRILLPRVSPRRPLLFTGPNGQRWAFSTEADRWDATRTALAAAGLRRHITSHCLRHGYNTWLSSHRLHPEKIALVMGHRTGKRMARTYTQLSPADLEQIRKVATTLVPESAWPGR